MPKPNGPRRIPEVRSNRGWFTNPGSGLDGAEDRAAARIPGKGVERSFIAVGRDQACRRRLKWAMRLRRVGREMPRARAVAEMFQSFSLSA